MPSATAAHEHSYGLEAIAEHNATTTTEPFPSYEENSKGLGIYHDYYQPSDPSYTHNNPPTPRSDTPGEGVRTRSGRSTRRTDSPVSTSNKSRVSKSPAARSKKDKKSKIDKSKMPKLTAPLSVLTKDMDVPLKDMEAWVNRPSDVRHREAEKREGYITRPMNSFMLYRSAYAERTKAWCVQNNHQVVSSVSGESWPMEPEEVRQQFNEWAKIERANHAKAHPEYKFSPSKSTSKRRKGEFSDDEDEVTGELDGDPDGEYRGTRNVRQRRQQQQGDGMNQVVEYLPAHPVGFESHPYFSQQGYEMAQYGGVYGNHARALPSNVAYDANGLAYNPATGAYLPMQQQHPSYQYAQEMRTGARIPTPNSVHGGQSLGGYGLPGAPSADDLFASASRTATPLQLYGQQYSYPQYSQTQMQHYRPAYHPPTPVQHQLYEHQQYLQQVAQPQAAIDPSLEAALAANGGSHFEDAIGDFVGGPEYFEESTSPNQTLAPRWEPVGDGLGGA